MFNAIETFLPSSLNFVFLVENADFMRSVGKIYVVVAVLVIIFIGLALYLFIIDKRISKLEKNNKNE